MTTAVAAPPPVSLPRRTLRILLALFVVAAGLSLAGVSLAPAPAQAAPVAIDQCNGRNAGPAGATTGITCSVTVVNTINGGARSSSVTVARTCSLNPCDPSDTAGLLTSVTTNYTDVVTDIAQCNNSGNDAAPPLITCTVTVTNNISADTPGAQPEGPATVNQCNGSATSGGPYGSMALLVCSPFPATTDPATATVIQCNDSVTGGGSTADCAVPASDVSPAIPIRVRQCNNSGIAGGTLLTCDTLIITNITAAVVTTTPTPTTGGGTSTGGTATGTSTTPQITLVPSGGVPAGANTGGGLSPSGLLALGTALLLSAATTALLGWRRAARRR